MVAPGGGGGSYERGTPVYVLVKQALLTKTTLRPSLADTWTNQETRDFSQVLDTLKEGVFPATGSEDTWASDVTKIFAIGLAVKVMSTPPRGGPMHSTAGLFKAFPEAVLTQLPPTRKPHGGSGISELHEPGTQESSHRPRIVFFHRRPFVGLSQPRSAPCLEPFCGKFLSKVEKPDGN